MRCAELQALLCEYVEGALTDSERTLVERHLDSCPACAAMTREASAALTFLRTVPDVEPPPLLVNRILFDIPSRTSLPESSRSPLAKWLKAWIRPLLQPRFAMGMAMTILSFSMLARFAGIGPRQLSAAELNPIRLWQALDDTAHRTWERARKFYLSVRLLYEIQAQLQEWSQQLREETASSGPPAPNEQDRSSPTAEPPAEGRPPNGPDDPTGDFQP